MVLYGPKQCCMIRAYRCAALDTPLAYIRKKIDPRPPGPQAPGAVFWPPGRILAQKSVFAIGPRISSMGRFLALNDIFNLAPLDWFLVAVRPLGKSFSGHRAWFLPVRNFFFWPTGFGEILWWEVAVWWGLSKCWSGSKKKFPKIFGTLFPSGIGPLGERILRVWYWKPHFKNRFLSALRAGENVVFC